MIGNLRVHKHWAMLLGVVATLALILGMSPAVARAQEVDQTLRIQQPLSSEFYNHVKFPDGTYHDTFKPDAFVLRGVSQSDATVPTNGVGFVGKVAYCIDPEREVGGPYTKGTAQPFGDYSNSNNSTNKMRGDAEAYRKVNWIAHNTFPVKSAADVYAAAGIDAAKKPQLTRVIAGANFAMWHFSHGYDFSEATLDPETKAIYDYFTGPQNVGLDSVDSSNQTGLIFNHDDPNYQDAIIVDNETKPSGDKPEQPSTPEEPAKELKPSIATQARLDGNKVVAGAVVKDTVAFKDLVAGKQYHLDAKLVNKNNENEVLGTGSLDFKAEAAEGEQEVIITVSEDVTVPVESAVAFEKLTSTEVNADGTENTTGESVEIATHEDINDADQTVHGDTLKPEISTQANTNADQIAAGAVIVDTVHFKDLVVGKNYTLNAQLINKADENQVLGKGTLDFKPETTEGDVDVEIVVDEGVKPVAAAVAFESLVSAEVNADGTPNTSGEAVEVAKHQDINDANQTVTGDVPEEPDVDVEGKEPTKEPKNPSIKTKAELVGDQVVAGSTVNDTVTFTDLVPDKGYTLHAQLINKADGKTVIGEGSKTFTPDAANGSVVVPIKVHNDVTEAVESAVAFEELTSKVVDAQGKDVEGQDDNAIANHKDLTDKDQTVTSKPKEEPAPEDSKEPTPPEEMTKPLNPSIETVANLKENQIVAGSTVVDTVKFEDLVPDKTYVLNAELINKADNSVIGHGAASFEAKTSSGSVNVEITVDKNVTKPVAEAVAFEKMTSTEVNPDGTDNFSGQPVDIADHQDINDENQTVIGDVPETEEGDTPPAEDNEDNTAPSNKQPTSSVPATPSKPETNEPNVDVEGKEPTNKPDTPMDQVKPDESKPDESKPDQSKPDQSKPDQSKPDESKPDQSEPTESKPAEPNVDVQGKEPMKPTITTSAGIKGQANVEKGNVVIDTVHFTGLKPGTKYTLHGELMCKETGKSTGATGSIDFVPTSANGSVDVPITITDGQCKEQVAFETLTDVNGKEVAVHKDINSASQTVTDGKAPVTPEETTPATPEQTPGAEGGNNAASTTNNIGTVIGQNNVNVTIIGGTGQAKVKDHGHALAPNTERRTIKNVPSGPTGLATHAMPNVATK